MDTWLTMADGAQRDAAVFLTAGRLRAAVNRCYFALFSHLADLAQRTGYAMPVGREGPRHEAVYGGGLVSQHLRNRLEPSAQSQLIFIGSLLYKLRCDADYAPSREIGPNDARLAFGRMIEARRLLRDAR